MYRMCIEKVLNSGKSLFGKMQKFTLYANKSY